MAHHEFPLVSIVIPVYNGSNYLREAINSALAQTYENIEVLVVNDGSRDDGATENIARSYGDRIRYLYKENGGVATALNLGIQLMQGEYFSWLSHDDIYVPNKIEMAIAALLRDGDVTRLVFSEYELLNVDSGVSSPVRLGATYSEQQLTNGVFPVIQHLIHGCDVLVHRSHFTRVGIFNEELRTTQDYDLWFRMFRFQKALFIPEPLVISRLHPEQGSKTINRFELERSELHIGFMNRLTEQEMVSMYGSPYNYYYQLSCFFKGSGLQMAYELANERFQAAVIPDILDVQLEQFREKIERFSEGKARRLCIFGTGNYGLRLLQELQGRRVQVDCFSDNNPNKWGQKYDEVECVAPKVLEEQKETTLILVAARTPAEMIEQLTSAGFPYVHTKQELDEIFIQTPPDRR
ncbi:glycosyltransferase [Cohnella sp. GCM10027633]|uniref:glycosyltransferase n=1 Tax=unclassified Cohnella TaxID=2636738 RepID=UPI0036391ACF